ncbi:hypothetical protein NVP1199A_73 [Vibrio phage 1.199.A._10N.286.55.C10]|nr:hypothetical protein NVP1199A_73 [Vibrio phage 1.199.A._10N.286.55.C10]AUR95016.1 hypothetical protein NVP1199B_73 [Vibrio phage 1.199.B._10N.286.55.C10]
MKTFETEKHNIPKGATHYWNESCKGFFAWWNENTKEMLCPDGLGSWCRVSDVSGDIMHEIPKPRTKTEFVKIEYNHAWEIIKLYEDGEELFKTNSDELQIERINSIALRAQAGYPFYRKVETEIDERQEFIERMLEMLDLNEAYDGNKIVSDMYDNFGFRFKLMETEK